MKFLTLTLSLLVTACLTADNSSNQSSYPNGNVNVPCPQREAGKSEIASQQEDEHEFRKLQNYVDFDPRKYFTDLVSKQVTIYAASQMSNTELDDLESASDASAMIAQNHFRGEEYVQAANSYLAKLFKLGKPTNVQQSTFDAWKDLGFSDRGFIGLVKEALQHSPNGEYCKHLTNNASMMHLFTGNFLQMCDEDSQKAKYHFAQRTSINFIYHGLTKLGGSDSAEFERCITNESLDGIRALGKKIVSSKQFSRQVLKNIWNDCSIDNDVAEGNKIALMANGFIMEVLLAGKEEDYKDIQNQLRNRGIEFDVKSAVENKDPMEIVNLFNAKAVDNDTKNLCVQAVKVIWSIKSITNDLNTLEDQMSNFKGAADNEFTFIIKEVIEPAIILINSKEVLLDKINAGFFLKLNDRSSKEEAQRRESYILLIEKSHDYLTHTNDIGYIRRDFDKMANEFNNFKRIRAFNALNVVVQALKKDDFEVQKCSFDLSRRKLICNSPLMLEMLSEIQGDKFACNNLIKFCEMVRTGFALPTAIAVIEAHIEKFWNTYNTNYLILSALHPQETLRYIKNAEHF